MFDLTRTVTLVKGALFDSEATWRAYHPEAGDWQKTAAILTAPLILASTIVAYLLALVFSGDSLFGHFRPTLSSSLVSIVGGAITVALVAWIFSALAGAFGGKSSFALALAAVTLAFVPGYLGQALTWLPWVGGLVGFVLFIYALVLLWRIIPLYLEVPGDKRVMHYVLSLIASILVLAIIGSLLSKLMPQPDLSDFGSRYSEGSNTGLSSTGAGGMVSAAIRQGELLAAAEQDQYTPPADGELSDQQVQEFIRVMDRAADAQQAKQQRIKEISERAEKNDDVSFSDIGEMMGGITSLAGPAGGEMEIVKSSGGNWAEHVWVRETLRTAWLQKDINDAVKHNYKLYQKYEDALARYVAR